MADSQVPWGVDALAGAVSEPAWKTKPSYYLVASNDKMIPPPAQRQMAERGDLTCFDDIDSIVEQSIIEAIERRLEAQAQQKAS